MLSNFCRNLAGGHLVDRFSTDDASTKSVGRETLFGLSFCLTRTEEQDGFCVTRHFFVTIVETATRSSAVASERRQSSFETGHDPCHPSVVELVRRVTRAMVVRMTVEGGDFCTSGSATATRTIHAYLKDELSARKLL